MQNSGLIQKIEDYRNSKDKKLHKKLSKNSLEIAKKYDWKELTHKLNKSIFS